MSIDKKIVADLVANEVGFVTTVPCKQLAGVIDEIDKSPDILHVPSNKEDEAWVYALVRLWGARDRLSLCRTPLSV